MTVRLESTIKRYIGLSTDEKPTPGLHWPGGEEITHQDVPAGSSLLATDTNEVWHWNGWEWTIGDSPEVRELKEIEGLLGVLIENTRPRL